MPIDHLTLLNNISVIAPTGQTVSNPVIQWKAEANCQAMSYSILIRDSGNKVVHNKRHSTASLKSTRNQHSMDLGLNLTPGHYKLWVRGVNTNEKGRYSQHTDFTVRSGSMLPEQVSVDEIVRQNNGKTTIKWTEEPNGCASSYSILIKAADQSIVHNRSYSLASIKQCGIQHGIQLSLKLEDGAYRVWVRGVNACGKGRYSSPRHLHITT